MAARAAFQGFQDGPLKCGANTLGSSIASRMFIGRHAPRRFDPLQEYPQGPWLDAKQCRRALKRDAGNRTVNSNGNLLGRRLPPHAALSITTGNLALADRHALDRVMRWRQWLSHRCCAAHRWPGALGRYHG